MYKRMRHMPFGLYLRSFPSLLDCFLLRKLNVWFTQILKRTHFNTYLQSCLAMLTVLGFICQGLEKLEQEDSGVDRINEQVLKR